LDPFAGKPLDKGRGVGKVAQRKTATGCGCGKKKTAGGKALTIARRMKNTNHFKLLMLLLRL